jgi:NADPH:quinone reductase-like Zn-dependent oxidoreductase
VVTLDIIELFRRGHRILGFRMATPEEIRQSLRMALDGRIRVPLARTFPLREADAAHAFLARREHVGKVVLTLS